MFSPQKKKYTNKTLQRYWESCDETFAHLKIDKWLENEESLYLSWKENFLSKLSFSGKTVFDYGIGGGYLGKLLLKDFAIKKYIGCDIAKRSMLEAQGNLAQFPASFFQFIHESEFHTYNFLDVDIFISQACIQHFPDKRYLLKFLAKLNRSKVPQLVLQIRYSSTTIFIKNNPLLATRTNSAFLQRYLSNYTITYASDIKKNGYQFFIFTHKKQITTKFDHVTEQFILKRRVKNILQTALNFIRS